ncbi:MAG: regulatory protein GemA [Ruminococcus sp.]|nr:regulatory protein GemA [Ruminococcus sp.]
MAKITRKLYALATELNLVERGNPEDDFHIIVFRVTGKSHVSELDEKETNEVMTELLEIKQQSEYPDKISVRQQKKAWALIYELCRLDPSDADEGSRLCGAVKKILNKSSAKSDPFRFVKKWDADRLLNTLDGYVRACSVSFQK